MAPRPLPNADIMGIVVSNLLFREYGIGPSQSICKPFAEAFLAEAEKVRPFTEGG